MTPILPSMDILGLPGPTWLLRSLMALTLGLHWFFLAGTLGGLVVLLLARRRPSDDEAARLIESSLAPHLPFSLALALTMGVAPLLFVQVLYGHVFYPATILQALPWLGLIPLVIAVFYLLYLTWWRPGLPGSRQATGVPLAALGLLVVAASVLAAVATLAQSPGAWLAVAARRGVGLAMYHGDPTFGARLLMALSGMIGLGGVLAGLAVLLHGAGPDDARREALHRVLATALPALAVHAASGLLVLARLPAEHRAALLASADALAVGAAGLAAVGTLALLTAVRRAPGAGSLAAVAGLGLTALVLEAHVRDLVRVLALGGAWDEAGAVVNAQTGPFVLWVVVVVAGLGVVGWLVRLALREG